MKLMNGQRKRLISFVLAFAMIISIFSIMPLSVSAAVGDVFTVGSLTYTVTADKEVKISGFDQVSTEAVIEETVNYEGVDYKITAIDATTEVFRKCTSLEKIIFNNPNLNIIARTFYGASALKEIYINFDIMFDDMAISRTPNLENIYCYSSNISYKGYPFPDMESSPNLKFYGYDGSSTEKFAKEQEYPFISLGAIPSTEPSTEATEPSTEPKETTVPLPVGESFTVGSLTYTVTADNEVKISGFDRVSTEAVIDETVNYEGVNYKITAIDATTDVFRKCTSLEKITFKNPNLNIIERTFYGATSLKEIYIYSDITFDSYSFTKTPVLENVYCYSPNITYNGYPFQAIADTPNLKFYGYDGSSTEKFAKEQEYPFISLGAIPSTEPSTEATEPSTASTEPSTEPSTVATEPSTGPEDTSIFTWQTIDDGTAVEITGFKDEYKYTYNVVIPSEINGLPVTSIGYNAFYGLPIATLEFPSSVKVIGERAFRDCMSLKTITFPEDSHLEVIGNYAFYRVQGDLDLLNEVVLPASLKQIGYRAFYNRANLLTVKVLSKDVVFGDPVKGKEVFDIYDKKITSKLKIYGYTGSTAETYAQENNHMFRYLDLNTDELQALYDKANAIDSSLYTKESYAALEVQIKAAKKMLANRDATPEMVDECIKNLQAAIDGLVEYVPTVPTTAPIEYAEYIVGDVDGDLVIKINDATTVQKHSAELLALTGTDLLAADIDGDGFIDIKDVTIIQKWLADFDEAMGYKIGEKVTIEVQPTQPTDPQPTDPQPTTSPDYETFYVPNYVSWLTDLGGKMWIYNDATEEFTLMDYDMDFRYFWIDLPKDWTELSLYRTPFEITEEEFDINSPWDDEAKTGVILNKWEHLGDRGTNNSYKITGDGEGFYTMFDPDIPQPDERTIYFDNSTTQWGSVYIYGWSFGLSQEFVQMEPVGNDIWSYTFYGDLPVDGVKGFLFVNQDNWAGATQTNDLATQEGKNLFVPRPGGQKLSGSWSVYTP